MTDKKTFIGNCTDKRAVTVTRELGTKSPYGSTDAYNVAILGAAHHLVAQGQPNAAYGGQYANGNTFWFLPGADHAITVTYEQAKAILEVSDEPQS